MPSNPPYRMTSPMDIQWNTSKKSLLLGTLLEDQELYGSPDVTMQNCNKMWRPEMVLLLSSVLLVPRMDLSPPIKGGRNPHPSNGRISEARRSAFFVGSFRTLRYEIILGVIRQASEKVGILRRNSQLPNANHLKQVLEKNPRVHELTSDLATCDCLEFLLQWWSDLKHVPNTLGPTEIKKDFKHEPFSTRLPCLAVTRIKIYHKLRA